MTKKPGKYPKLRELGEAVRALLRGPVTTRFPREPHTPQPGFRGKPVPDAAACIACGACAQVCPARAIEVTDRHDCRPAVRDVTWHYDICIFCGQCERLCTTKTGVVLSPEYDLATFDRSTLVSTITAELVTCERCGTTIAPLPQLDWLVKRLGPLASGNFNLLYTAQHGLNLAEETAAAAGDGTLSRADLFKVLCPKCRHVAVVFNQTGKQPPLP